MKYFNVVAALLMLCFAAGSGAGELADEEITKNIKIEEVAECEGNLVKEIKNEYFAALVISDKNHQEQICFRDSKTKRIFRITGIVNEHRPFSNIAFGSSGILAFDRYANPRFGFRYEINLQQRKVIRVSVISDEASLSSDSPATESKTVVNDANAKSKLLGKHRFSLQWISWNYFGTAMITEQDGILRINAEQKSRENKDYVRMNGILTVVDSLRFGFKGTIETQVSHINKGKPCKREGDFEFAIKANRKYWRLREMNNPCEEVVDYVDIFF